MRYILKLALLVFISTIIVSKSSNWIEIETDTDFATAVHINPIILAIFYDSTSCGFCKKYVLNLYNGFLDDELLREHKVGFVRADVARVHDTKQKYGLDKKSHLMLFVKGHKIEMENFHETQVLLLEKKIENKELYNKVKSFLYEKIMGISKEIKTIEELSGLVKEKRFVIAYVGDKNIKYKLYYKIAKKIAEEQLYHIFDPEIKNNLSFKYNAKNLPTNDYIAVIKDTSQITSFDTDRIVTMEVNNNAIAIERFIEFERYPKFRGFEYSKTNIEDIMKFGHQMLLYVRTLPVNNQKFGQYIDAVKKLPKRFIYSYVDLKSKHNEAYQMLFSEAGVKQEPESLYFIYKTSNRKFNIEKYKGDIDSNRIINFVLDFFREKGYMFGNAHQTYINEYLEPFSDGNSQNTLTEEL